MRASLKTTRAKNQAASRCCGPWSLGAACFARIAGDRIPKCYRRWVRNETRASGCPTDDRRGLVCYWDRKYHTGAWPKRRLPDGRQRHVRQCIWASGGGGRRLGRGPPDKAPAGLVSVDVWGGRGCRLGSRSSVGHRQDHDAGCGGRGRRLGSRSSVGRGLCRRPAASMFDACCVS